MRRESLCCLRQRYVTATFDCKQRWRHGPPKLAVSEKCAPSRQRVLACARSIDATSRALQERERDADVKTVLGFRRSNLRERDRSLDASADHSGDQRPSGVRTPIQLSRTC